MTVLFVHIPKTAGTSVRVGFESALGEESVIWWGHRCSENAFEKERERGFSGYRVAGGHLPENILGEFNTQAVRCTVLRDPVERIVSLHNYIVRTRSHPLHKEIWPNSVRKSIVLSQGFRGEVEDRMCRMLCGTPCATEAIDKIKEATWVVGCVERLNRLAESLASVLEVNTLALGRENAAPSGERGGRAGIEEDDYNWIKRWCYEDIRLYQWLLEEHGGLYSGTNDVR